MIPRGKIETWYMPQGLTITKNKGDYEAPCPTCKRHGNITVESLTKHQVDPIREAVRQGVNVITTEWIKKYFPSRASYSNYSKGKKWGLLDEIKQGEYRITDQARQFLRGEITLPSKLPIFDDHARYIEGYPDMYGEQITIDTMPPYEPMNIDKARENMVAVKVSPQEGMEL